MYETNQKTITTRYRELLELEIRRLTGKDAENHYELSLFLDSLKKIICTKRLILDIEESVKARVRVEKLKWSMTFLMVGMLIGYLISFL